MISRNGGDVYSVPKFVLALGAVVSALPALAQCGFQSKPIAGFSWYRAEGWPTPGIDDADSVALLTVNRDGLPLIVDGRKSDWPEGLTASRLMHERDYHLVFPAAVYEDNGQRRQLQPAGFSLVALLRWDVRGKPYAYSYTILSDTVACGFSMDLIDDVGDGKFRILKSSDRMTIGFPPIPAWVSKPNS
jgi:hypothetical protein